MSQHVKNLFLKDVAYGVYSLQQSLKKERKANAVEPIKFYVSVFLGVAESVSVFVGSVLRV